MGNAQLQQKLRLFIDERRRVYEAMMSVIRAENLHGRAGQSSVSAAQVWNDLQAEYGRIEQDIQDVQVLLARYRRPD